MARKSRKNQVLPESVQVQATEKTARQLLATAAYVRLSVENSGNSTDDTLQTQIKLVHNFIANHPDLKLADTYIDNGFTGTNFDRPEFERLMQDVKLGKIQCVVVKDLSRFGRDYLETGHYLETIFPRLNIRFIAVTDDFDSFRPGDVESLATPIKNLVNSLYAKDISNKLRAVNANKRKRGERCGSFPPYGLKLTEDRKNYLPDQETVPYVRAIYVWKLLDVNKHEIVRRLELLQAPSPRQLQRMHSDNTAHLQDNTTWLPGAVARILENPVYVGDTVTGKTKPLASSYKRVRTRREDWTVTTNTHEAVILRSDYDAVQEIADAAKQKWRAAIAENAEERAKLPDLFHGQVHCAGCGAPMVLLRRGSAAKPLFNVYTCKSDRHKYACYGTKIQERLLQALVMDQISVLIKAMCSRKKMLEEMTQNDTSKNVLHSLKRKAAYLSGKIAEAEERKSGLYKKASESAYSDLGQVPSAKTEHSGYKTHFDLSGYQIARAQFFSTRQDPAMTISANRLTFNTACLKKFENVAYVELLFNSIEKCIAIRPCSAESVNAIRWGTVKERRWTVLPKSCAGFATPLYNFMGWNDQYRYRFRGEYHKQDDEQILFFDLVQPEVIATVSKQEITAASSDFEDQKCLEDRTDLPDESAEIEKSAGNKDKRVTRIMYPCAWADSFGDDAERDNFLLLQRIPYYGAWDILRPARTVDGLQILNNHVLEDLMDEAKYMIEKMRCTG